MLKHLITIMLLNLSFFTYATTYVDAYEMKMRVSIPRVYDNMTSLGYRRYLSLVIVGTVFMSYEDRDDSTASIEFCSFTNKTHKTSSNKPISYEVFNDEDQMQYLSVIGNNKTKVFNRGNCCVNVIFEPSYSISDKVTEDNSLYIRLSSINGKFKTKNGRKILYSMSGRVAGTVGCACSDYGHVSPTRMLGYWGPMQYYVIDVAACEGTWLMKYKYSFSY